jgi:hypothetical protein
MLLLRLLQLPSLLRPVHAVLGNLDLLAVVCIVACMRKAPGIETSCWTVHANRHNSRPAPGLRRLPSYLLARNSPQLMGR